MNNFAQTAYFATPADERCKTIDEFLAILKGRKEGYQERKVRLSHLTPIIDADSGALEWRDDMEGTVYSLTGIAAQQHFAAIKYGTDHAKAFPWDVQLPALHHAAGRTPTEWTAYGRPLEGRFEAVSLNPATYSRIWSYDLMREFIGIALMNGLEQLPIWETVRTGKPGGLFAGVDTGLAGETDVAILGRPEGSIVIPNPAKAPGEDTLFPIAALSNGEFGNSVPLRGFCGLVRATCGNLGLFGFKGREWNMRHRGDIHGRVEDLLLPQFQRQLSKQAFGEDTDMIGLISKAADFLLPNWDETVDLVVSKAKPLTAKEAKAVVTKAIQEEGECRTVWQLCNGATAMARDQRVFSDGAKFQLAAENILRIAA